MIKLTYLENRAKKLTWNILGEQEQEKEWASVITLSLQRVIIFCIYLLQSKQWTKIQAQETEERAVRPGGSRESKSGAQKWETSGPASQLRMMAKALTGWWLMRWVTTVFSFLFYFYPIIHLLGKIKKFRLSHTVCYNNLVLNLPKVSVELTTSYFQTT